MKTHSHWISVYFQPYVFSTVLNTTLEKTFSEMTEEVLKEGKKKKKVKKQEAKHAGTTHTWPYQTENVCWKPPSYAASQDTLAQVEDATTWTLVGAWGLVPAGSESSDKGVVKRAH